MTRPTLEEALLAWSPGGGLVPGPPDGVRLLAADSWLLRDGRMRGHARHRERFLRACSESGGPPPRRLVEFWHDMTAALPRTGEWFPRVELTAEKCRLRLLLRQAPPLAADVRVWAVGQPDPRTVPRRKGPDLAQLAGVRSRAGAHGADEAVLVSASGLVLEGAHSSLVWWEDDVLCLPPPQLPVLAGVTAGLVLERAQRRGVPVAHRERTVRELDGREVWLVNALHGIRPVTAWTGQQHMNAGPAVRAAEWRAWLDGMMAPLPAAPRIPFGRGQGNTVE